MWRAPLSLSCSARGRACNSAHLLGPNNGLPLVLALFRSCAARRDVGTLIASPINLLDTCQSGCALAFFFLCPEHGAIVNISVTSYSRRSATVYYAFASLFHAASTIVQKSHYSSKILNVFDSYYFMRSLKTTNLIALSTNHRSLLLIHLLKTMH